MQFVINAKKFRSRLLQILSRKKISSQISLTYALILFFTLIFTSIATTAGVHYLFHRQAARALDFSIERTMEKISELNELDNDFLNFGTVLPGVILRVTDDEGRKIIDNDPNFPELKKVSTFARENPPFWSSEKYKFLEMPRSYFYYKELSSEIGGRLFHFHFFRNITFEKEFIGYLLLTLFAVNFVSLFLAIMSGYFWSIKILFAKY